MVAAFPPSEGLPLDRVPEQAVADSAALRQHVIRDLARLITNPGEGVSALDRVEAVRLLGQLGGATARLTLAGVLREGPRLRPSAVGRWLRDTALDTLLRDPDRAATTHLLTAYYRLDRRLLRGRLERNLVYDDIPTLLAHQRAGVLVRGYLVPLLGALVVVPLLIEVFALTGLVSSDGPVGTLLGILFFLAIGLGLFNLHQVGLVLLVAWAGSRLPLLHLERAFVRVGWALVLAVLALGVFIGAFLGIAYLVALLYGSILNAKEQIAGVTAFVEGCVLVLPLLILPCYMLAHDLETAAHDRPSGGRPMTALAVILRWAVGILYVAFVYVAFALSYVQNLAANRNRSPGDAVVLLGTYPSLIYLALAPLLVLAFLAGLGWIQRRITRPSHVTGVT